MAKWQEENEKRVAAEMQLQGQIDGLLTTISTNQTEVNKSLAALDKRNEAVTSSLDVVKLQLIKIAERMEIYHRDKCIMGSVSSSDNIDHFTHDHPRGEQPKPKEHIPYPGGSVSFNPSPKLDFPRFDGTNPRAWLLRCRGYFKVVNSILEHDKVTIASIHFDGPALEWYAQISQTNHNISWEQFVEMITARFDDLKEGKILAEFSKLKLVHSLEDYIAKFSELKSYFLMFPDTTYTESYFINTFIGGLSAEMQICLFLSEPTTLQSAIDLARQQEATIEVASKRNRVFTKSISSHPSVQQKPFPQNPPSPSFNTKAHNYTPPTLQSHWKILSISEMRARREKGLCYNCDEPFTPGHKCKTPHIYLLMAEDEEAAYSSSQVDHTNAEDDVDEAVELSLNAMVGSSGVRTLKVQGFSGKHKLLILIDTGSTHSFISDSLAFKLKCKIQNIIPT